MEAAGLFGGEAGGLGGDLGACDAAKAREGALEGPREAQEGRPGGVRPSGLGDEHVELAEVPAEEAAGAGAVLLGDKVRHHGVELLSAGGRNQGFRPRDSDPVEVLLFCTGGGGGGGRRAIHGRDE